MCGRRPVRGRAPPLRRCPDWLAVGALVKIEARFMTGNKVDLELQAVLGDLREEICLIASQHTYPRGQALKFPHVGVGTLEDT